MAAHVPAAAARRRSDGVTAIAFSAVALVLVAAAGLLYPAVPHSFRGLVQRLTLLIIFAWMAATAVFARRGAGH
jgi:hypothetical protein